MGFGGDLGVGFGGDLGYCLVGCLVVAVTAGFFYVIVTEVVGLIMAAGFAVAGLLAGPMTLPSSTAFPVFAKFLIEVSAGFAVSGLFPPIAGLVLAAFFIGCGSGGFAFGVVYRLGSSSSRLSENLSDFSSSGTSFNSSPSESLNN